MQSSKIPTALRYQTEVLCVLEQLMGPRRFQRFLGPIRRRVLKAIERRLEGQAPPPTQAVAHRVNLKPEDFHRDFLLRSHPVVFSQAAKNWPCCQNWDLAYLAKNIGESEVFLTDAPGLTTREEKVGYMFLKLKELIAGIERGEDKYLRFSPLLHDNFQLVKDLDLNWLESQRGGRTFASTYYMFIGGAGQKTLLHNDQPCNLFVQVHGEKRWTLFLPEDSLCLYPEITNTAYVKSPIDLDHVDHQRFPLFRHARRFDVILKAGDVLYVPPHVWHQVENLTSTVAVGYRFSSLRHSLHSSPAFSLIRVLATNPPVWKTRKYGAVDTNLIWAHTNGTIGKVLEERENRRQIAAASIGPEIRPEL